MTCSTPKCQRRPRPHWAVCDDCADRILRAFGSPHERVEPVRRLFTERRAA